MGIHHLNSPNWQGEGEYRLAFYEGQVYGLENTIITLLFVLIVLSMIKKILFGNAMKRQIPRQVFDRLVSQQYLNIDQNSSQQHQAVDPEFLGFDMNQDDDSMKYVKRFSFCQNAFSFFIILFLWSIGISAAYLFSLTNGFEQVELGPSIMSCLMLFCIILYFSFRAGVGLACLGLMFLLAVMCSVFPLLFFQDICVCSNSESGYQVSNGQYLSTSFTRKYQLEKPCQDGVVCHLYATLAEDTQSQVIFNIHTGIGIEVVQVIVTDSSGQEYFNHILEKNQEEIELDKHGQRNTYSIVVSGLQDNREYQVQVIDADTQTVLKSMKYRTLPTKEDVDSGVATLKMAFAGDWATNTYTGLLNTRLVAANPDVIVFGGNVAMDNGMKNCYHAWDLFLWNFERQIFDYLDGGRIVPFIIATGNKDVGINSMKGFNATVSPDLGPLLFAWVPQTVVMDDETNNQVVSTLTQRKSYHIHAIGNVALFVLDSGYFSDFNGTQLEWMNEAAEKYSSYYKFAVYHYPIYPSCTLPESKWDSPWSSREGEEHWVPFFDENDFVAAFETHSKQFKRTFPMKARLHSNAGTVYFGDANQSDEMSPDCKAPPVVGGIFDKVSTIGNLQHFWSVRLFNQTAHFDALSKDPKYSLEKDYTIDLTAYSSA